jgi:hypothetical protein
VATQTNLICVPDELAHLLEEISHADKEYRKTESDEQPKNWIQARDAGGVERGIGTEA